MKRLIASRKLQRRCINRECLINKGEVYYKFRQVYEDPDGIFASEYLMCAKCNYQINERSKRKKVFIGVCSHPEHFLEEVWSYIPGEAVMEPDYVKCQLCKERF